MKRKSINQAMELKMQEVDKVVSQVGKLVSQMTNLPAYAMAARAARADSQAVRPDPRGQRQLYSRRDAERRAPSRISSSGCRSSVTEADLKLLGAVLNASLTELAAGRLHRRSCLASVIAKSPGAAASLVPVIVDFTTRSLQEQRCTVRSI